MISLFSGGEYAEIVNSKHVYKYATRINGKVVTNTELFSKGARQASGWFKWGGRGIFFVSLGKGFIDMYGNLKNENYADVAKNGIDMYMGYLGAYGGVYGFILSGSYFVLTWTGVDRSLERAVIRLYHKAKRIKP